MHIIWSIRVYLDHMGTNLAFTLAGTLPTSNLQQRLWLASNSLFFFMTRNCRSSEPCNTRNNILRFPKKLYAVFRNAQLLKIHGNLKNSIRVLQSHHQKIFIFIRRNSSCKQSNLLVFTGDGVSNDNFYYMWSIWLRDNVFIFGTRERKLYPIKDKKFSRPWFRFGISTSW